MTDDPVGDALSAVSPQILQPALREPAADERIVRTGGLKFILPMTFKPGDVLDEQTALFLNTAHHTAVINRFNPIRKALLENPATTYEDIDRELQAHFENFKHNPRPIDTSDGKPAKTDEDKLIEAYARPQFNKVYGGKGLARADYEALLAEFISNNREMLKAEALKHNARISSLADDFEASFGN